MTQADLNWKNPEVREELKEVIRFGKMILKETEENFIQTDRTFMNI